MYTVKVEDLDFSAEFEIEFKQKEFCHALTAWFDVQFSKCHVTMKRCQRRKNVVFKVPVGFTTGIPLELIYLLFGCF